MIGFKYENLAPVAVGGVGGSGTRLIAQLLKDLGFYIGSDLNESLDNLWFALLFKRMDIFTASDEEFKSLLSIFLEGMTGEKVFSSQQIALVKKLSSIKSEQHPVGWLKERAGSLLAKKELHYPIDLLGWKAPNTHIIMDRLQSFLPRMKYIHVVRNGLDMAFSSNQNQLKLWGVHFIGPECQITPYYSLKYWRVTHERILRICRPMGERFLFLNYDEFCSSPGTSIKQLLEFLNYRVSEDQMDHLRSLVKQPNSIGRFKEHGTGLFDPRDVSFVRELGFDTDPG